MLQTLSYINTNKSTHSDQTITDNLLPVRLAEKRLRPYLPQTPLVDLPGLSPYLPKIETLFKLEICQPTRSFKVRGSFNKVLAEVEAMRRGQSPVLRVLYAASAGNHGQGVALVGRLLGLEVVIVVPEAAPTIKIQRMESLGARVVRVPGAFSEAYATGRALCEAASDGMWVDPYDDDLVIAGQGTIGLEIFGQLVAKNQRPMTTAVLVPVGGGGLIGGMAMTLKTLLGQNVRIIGVEPAAVPSMTKALRAGHPVRVEPHPTIADGTAVPCVGDRGFQLTKRYVDQVVTVDEASVLQAMGLLASATPFMVEGAGVLSVAALLNGALDGVKAERLVCVLSGANVELDAVQRATKAFSSPQVLAA